MAWELEERKKIVSGWKKKKKNNGSIDRTLPRDEWRLRLLYSVKAQGDRRLIVALGSRLKAWFHFCTVLYICTMIMYGEYWLHDNPCTCASMYIHMINTYICKLHSWIQEIHVSRLCCKAEYIIIITITEEKKIHNTLYSTNTPPYKHDTLLQKIRGWRCKSERGFWLDVRSWLNHDSLRSVGTRGKWLIQVARNTTPSCPSRGRYPDYVFYLPS